VVISHVDKQMDIFLFGHKPINKWEVDAVFGTLILSGVHVCLIEATEVASWFMDK
jgi:hypothetical protein